MTRLADLNPGAHATPDADWRIWFSCPLCRKGVVMVNLVLGDPDTKRGAHGVNIAPPAWDQMTISPSIADEGKCTRPPCPGWHGYVIGGEVTP